MNEYKILHISNVMLGKAFPDYGLLGHNIRGLLLNKFPESVKSIVSENKIDYIFITGNLFGTNMYAEKEIEMVKNTFSEIGIPVVIIPGNLDSYNEVSIYRKIDFSENVKLIEHSNVVIKVDDNPVSFGYFENFNEFKETDLKNNGELIIFLNEFQENEEKNTFFLGNSVESFQIFRGSACVPPFSSVSYRESVDNGVGILEYTNESFIYKPLNVSVLKKINLNVKITDKDNNYIEELIKEHKGEDSIIHLTVEGIITNFNLLDYLINFEKKHRDSFFYIDFKNNAEISKDLINNIPEHMQQGIYIKNVMESLGEKEDKKELLREVIKYGLYYFN